MKSNPYSHEEMYYSACLGEMPYVVKLKSNNKIVKYFLYEETAANFVIAHNKTVRHNNKQSA